MMTLSSDVVDLRSAGERAFQVLLELAEHAADPSIRIAAAEAILRHLRK